MFSFYYIEGVLPTVGQYLKKINPIRVMVTLPEGRGATINLNKDI